MLLTLHTDFVDTEGNAKRQLTIKRNLSNNDGWHLFEAWFHLSRCKEMPGDIIDRVMGQIYEIIGVEVKSTLGLNEEGYRDGQWGIDDPTVHNKHEMSAIITVNV